MRPIFIRPTENMRHILTLNMRPFYVKFTRGILLRPIATPKSTDFYDVPHLGRSQLMGPIGGHRANCDVPGAPPFH